jgi:epoxyqueuosine reductase
VVIDAERCLTYLNEHQGGWPHWLDPAAHNALVGCMRCQLICPANKYHLRRERVVAEFDREEAEVVLLDLPSEDLPEPVRSKLALLDLDDYSTILGRNLRALVG